MELSRSRGDLFRGKEEVECLALVASRVGGIRALQALTETYAVARLRPGLLEGHEPST